MKAISLWQPWASLIAVGAKRIETRSWATSYSGELAICAAKRWSGDQRRLCYEDPFRSALLPLFGGDVPALVRALAFGPGLPLGKVVSVATLVSCEQVTFIRPKVIHRKPGITWHVEEEAAFGDYSRGRWMWLMNDIRPLPQPVPVVGRQGVFALHPAETETVRRQLAASGGDNE